MRLVSCRSKCNPSARRFFERSRSPTNDSEPQTVALRPKLARMKQFKADLLVLTPDQISELGALIRRTAKDQRKAQEGFEDDLAEGCLQISVYVGWYLSHRTKSPAVGGEKPPRNRDSARNRLARKFASLADELERVSPEVRNELFWEDRLKKRPKGTSTVLNLENDAEGLAALLRRAASSWHFVGTDGARKTRAGAENLLQSLQNKWQLLTGWKASQSDKVFLVGQTTFFHFALRISEMIADIEPAAALKDTQIKDILKDLAEPEPN